MIKYGWLLGDYTYYKARLSLRLSVGIWLLTMIILVNAYTGTLTAFLTVPKLKPTVDTFEELANSQEKTLIIEPNTALSIKIMVCLSNYLFIYMPAI